MYPIEILHGILSTIFILISMLVGVRIALKYRETKMRLYLFFGFTWILIVQPWYPCMFSFFFNLLTPIRLDLRGYLLFEVFIPFSLLFGIAAATELIYRQYQKQIFASYAVFGTMFTIALIVMLVVDPTLIGTLNGPIGGAGNVDIEYSYLVKAYVLAMMVTILILGLLFTRESLNAPDIEVRTKGRMLMSAFIIFTVGTLIDTMIPDTILHYGLLILSKSLLIASSIIFLWGFFLPKFILNYIHRE